MKRFWVMGVLICLLLSLLTNKSYALASAMSAYASASQIDIHITNESPGTLYAYPANSYPSTDAIKGISKKDDDSIKVGDYTGGDAHLYRERAQDGKDHLYDKYYLMNNGNILAGPIYVNGQGTSHNIAFAQDSIKGLFNEDLENVDAAKDLGVSSITVNIDLAELLAASSKGAIPFQSQGKTYYFDTTYINDLDRRIIPASTNHMNVMAVIAAWNQNGSRYPDALTYDGHKAAVIGTNTSNTEGMDDYLAMMEFLAQRYSQDASHGLIQSYIIGNEIDFTPYFYNCDNLNTFMEEYTRSLRLASLAIGKYASDSDVVVPFTHYWCGDEKKIGKENSGASLKPYDMINWLAKVSKEQGDFNWNLAPHVYGSMNAKSNIAYTDVRYGAINGDVNKTEQLTYSNMELLQDYLSQDLLKYQGHMRSIYLTESGVSSDDNTPENLNKQAASFIQTYYKCAMLPFVKSYNYYRLYDHADETKKHLCVGLINDQGIKKPIYDVFKSIDTPSTLEVADPYLKEINYYKNGTKQMNTEKFSVEGWKDVMTVYDNNMDWSKQWNFFNIVKKSQQTAINTTLYNAASDAAHDCDQGEVVVAPTTTMTGIKRYRCIHCRAWIKDETIPVLKVKKRKTKKKKKKSKRKTVYVGQKIKLRYKGKYKYKTSNKKIAKVSKKGVITFKKTGKVTIKAVSKKKKYTLYYLVKKPQFKLTKKKIVLRKHKTAKIKVKVNKPKTKIKWKVKNKKIVRIKKGKVYALKKGRTTVYATAHHIRRKVTIIIK